VSAFDSDVLVLTERSVGRYLLIEPLGGGAMGEVWKAEDPDIGRTVAIKILNVPRSLEPKRQQEWEQRFLQEARAAGSLSHPGIVAIYDVGKGEDGRPFIVMEFIEGRGLDVLIADAQVLPIETALEWGAQIAEALDEAHRRGIVHRDVKPGNILIGPDKRPRLVDFGIAHIEQSEMTRDGTFLGTPAFTSPEQYRGETIDGRADLFSLGAVLYTLLAGVRPFGGQDLATLSWQICHSEPIPVEIAATWVPPRVGEAIRRALARDPGTRHQTGRDLAHDLRMALWKDRVADAEGPPPPRRFGASWGAAAGWRSPGESAGQGPGRAAAALVISVGALLGVVALAGWMTSEQRTAGFSAARAATASTAAGTASASGVSRNGKVASAALEGTGAIDSSSGSSRAAPAPAPASAPARAAAGTGSASGESHDGKAAPPAVESTIRAWSRNGVAGASTQRQPTAAKSASAPDAAIVVAAGASPANGAGAAALSSAAPPVSSQEAAETLATPPAPAASGFVRVEVHYGLTDGRLRLWSNDRLLVDQPLTVAERRKGLGKLLPKRGFSVFPLKLEPGRNRIRVEVTSAGKDIKVTREIAGLLEPGAHDWLEVRVKTWPEPKMDLDWETAGDQAEDVAAARS